MNNELKKWEEEFDSKFDYLNARHTLDQWQEYKDFIYSLLSTHDEELVKRIKGMNQVLNPNKILEGRAIDEAAGYNKALTDIIDIIKNNQ